MDISKIFFVLVFILFALAIGSCSKDDDCYSKVDNDGWQHRGFNCMPESQSYCGCDGKTYTSWCAVKEAGVTKVKVGGC